MPTLPPHTPDTFPKKHSFRNPLFQSVPVAPNRSLRHARCVVLPSGRALEALAEREMHQPSVPRRARAPRPRHAGEHRGGRSALGSALRVTDPPEPSDQPPAQGKHPGGLLMLCYGRSSQFLHLSPIFRSLFVSRGSSGCWAESILLCSLFLPCLCWMLG